MKVAAVVLAAVLAGPAVASVSDRPSAFLSFDEAIQFQKQYFPREAPKLLRDRHATFFQTKRPILVGGATGSTARG